MNDGVMSVSWYTELPQYNRLFSELVQAFYPAQGIILADLRPIEDNLVGVDEFRLNWLQYAPHQLKLVDI